ncbi:MAG: hypothetical protein KJ977_00125, partial [Candidatus Omnitrophica bacterium]|nr:hypothetical protein [Candidatus Omnitrophota bacterium]
MERVNKIKALKYFNIFFLVSSSLLLSLPIYAGTLDNLAGRSGPGQTPGNPRTTGNQVVLPQTGGSGRANIQPIVHPGSYATITEYKHDAKVSGMSDEQLKQAWQTQFNPPPPAVTTSQQPDQTRSETSDSRAPAARSYVEESMSEPTHLHPGMYSPDDFEAFANDAGGDVKDRAREFSFYWGMEDFSGDYFDNVRKIEAAHGEHGSWDFAATLLYAQLKIATERSGEFNPYLAYLAMALDHPGVTPDSFNASDWERDISSLAAAGVKGGELDAYLLSRASLLKAKAYDENTYTASHEKQAMERLLGLQVKPSDKSLSYWNLSTVDVMQASPRYARDFTAAFDKQMNHLFLNTPGAFNHTALDIWNGSVHLKAQNSSAYKGSFTNDFDKSINRMFLDTAGSFNKGSLEIWNNSSLAKMEQIGIYSSGFTPSFDKDMNEMFLAVPQAFDSFALNHWNYLAPEKMKKSSAYAEGFSAKFDQEMNEMFLDTAGSFDKVSLNVWNRVAALKMESSSRYAQEFTNVFDKSINQMFLAKSGAFNAYSLDVWNETAAPKMKGSEAYAKGFTNTFDGQMNKLFLDIDGAFSKHSLKVWDEALASKIKFSTTYADSFSDDFKQQMSEMISRELPRAQFNAEERMLAAFQPMNRQYFEENKHRLSPALPGTYEEYMTLVEKQADLTKKVVESFQRVIQTLDANYGKDNNPLRDMLMYGPKHIVLSPRLSNTLAGEAYVKENVLFLNPKSFDSPRDIDWHSAYYGTHEMLHLDYAQHVDPRYSDERFIHHETLQAVASLWALSSDNYNRISFNDDIAYKERDSQDPKRAERAKLAEEFYYR